MTVRPAVRPRIRRPVPPSVLSALVALAGAVVLALAVGPVGAASASLGSVPAEVSSYVTGGGMLARLSDVYGPNGKGNAGIAFDTTTKPGPISRVYEWTDARLAGQKTNHPVQLTNNWVVPISVGGRAIGLATVWINPQTVQPELADFTQDGALATAMATVPATAALVRDLPTHAWLALADGKVTPMVAGSSGLTKPVPVDSLKLSSTGAVPVTASAGPSTGLALAIGLVALIVVVIALALLLPRLRRAKPAPDAAPAATAPPATAPEPQPAPASPAEAPAPKAAPPKAATRKAATRKPATRKPATPKPATPKPATPRPAGRTPTTSSAAKPATSKPPAGRTPAASKSAASKPAASKPPASKPPAPRQPPRPRAPKPTGDDSES